MKLADDFQNSEITVHHVQRLLVLLEEKDKALQAQLEINKKLSERVQELEQQVKWFQTQLFGEKSEKRDYLDNPFQHTIADVLGGLPLPEKPKDEPKQQISFERGKAKKNVLDGAVDDAGLRFDESVPVEEIHIAPKALEGLSEDEYEIIDYNTTTRLAQKPSSFVIIRYIEPVIKLKKDKIFLQPATPPAVFERSYADVSFLAGMLVEKFIYHPPLHRQHQKLTQNGVLIARSTLTNWAKRAIELLRAIYEAQLKHILLSHVLAIDETYIKAGREKKGKLHQAYFWPIYGDHDEVCFTFSATRGTSHLRHVLEGFEGTLLSDGYKAYECYAKRLESLTHALCWTHSRRKFVEAEQSEPEDVAVALALIGKLYDVEDDLRQANMSHDKALAYRKKYAKPIVDRFFEWSHEQHQRADLLPSSPLRKALDYVIKREHGLQVFLTDASVPLDTNHLERTLRCVPMGRRNWLFCWTEIGAELVGIIQSLLTTCRLHDVNPYDYLVDVLQRVDRHPASRVHELTPREWKRLFSHDPLRSDLHKRDYALI